METAIPIVVLVVVAIGLSSAIPNFLSAGSLSDIARQAGEIGFVVLGLVLVMIVGGIDLSVGSMFALTNFCALFIMNVLNWGTVPSILLTLACGAVLGAFNGALIGYLRLRAFLTTLITLIIYRALYDILSEHYSTAIAAGIQDAPAWDFLGNGDIFGIPSVVYLYAAVAIFGHIYLTRLRPGWHVSAIGGSRRSAYNTGIAVRRTVASCYMISGVLTALGSIFFASRLATAAGDVGLGLEISVLTAAVLGGISLGGGSGSVTKATAGTLIVLLVINGLTALAFGGGYNRMVLASVLALAAMADVRWRKNRHRIVSKIYVSPTYHALPPLPSTASDCGTVLAQNDRLKTASPIGLGEIEGPEDVLLDRHDNLFAGNRHGDIIRFFPPSYKKWEVYAHIGGMPLGMAFDRTDNLYICIGGMGLYRVSPDRKVEKATDETNRSFSSINDDSRLRLADDLDIADDGRVFFSECTTRYEAREWVIDGLEGRGNGRLICFNPSTNKTNTVLRGLIFPNGICMADRHSLLLAETWNASIKRYWFDGPKKGKIEFVLRNLPGFPDNINLASDGNFWLALSGMRSPALDLAWRMPEFRKRMVKRLPSDEWLFPNINTGCVIKFNLGGEILETLWDLGGEKHPMITSMREHKGSLYLGGIANNRIGCFPLRGADPTFIHYETRWRVS